MALRPPVDDEWLGEACVTVAWSAVPRLLDELAAVDPAPELPPLDAAVREELLPETSPLVARVPELWPADEDEPALEVVLPTADPAARGLESLRPREVSDGETGAATLPAPAATSAMRVLTCAPEVLAGRDRRARDAARWMPWRVRWEARPRASACRPRRRGAAAFEVREGSAR